MVLKCATHTIQKHVCCSMFILCVCGVANTCTGLRNYKQTMFVICSKHSANTLATHSTARVQQQPPLMFLLSLDHSRSLYRRQCLCFAACVCMRFHSAWIRANVQLQRAQLMFLFRQVLLLMNDKMGERSDADSRFIRLFCILVCHWVAVSPNRIQYISSAHCHPNLLFILSFRCAFKIAIWSFWIQNISSYFIYFFSLCSFSLFCDKKMSDRLFRTRPGLHAALCFTYYTVIASKWTMVSAIGADARLLGQSKTLNVVVVFIFAFALRTLSCRADSNAFNDEKNQMKTARLLRQAKERRWMQSACKVCYGGRHRDLHSNEREGERKNGKPASDQKRKDREEKDEAKNKKSGYSSMFFSTFARYGLLIASCHFNLCLMKCING